MRVFQHLPSESSTEPSSTSPLPASDKFTPPSSGRKPPERTSLSRDEHIPFNDGLLEIYPTFREILQKPYSDGIGAGHGIATRIDYRPYGFSVGRVFSGDISEIRNAGETVFGQGGVPWPEKSSFHIEFCDPAFGTAFRKQQRVRYGSCRHPTKEAFARFVAKGIEEALSTREFHRFPYTLDDIRVVSIDVRSRGTLQSRIFVDKFAMAEDRINLTLGNMLQELQDLHDVTW